MATEENEILIENSGPINRVSIKLPPEFGVSILRGPNGAGKSNALELARAMFEGSGNVHIRDGADFARGQGLGISVRFGKRTTRSGELEVESLAGRLSIADLVDPKKKSPESADHVRIRALITLVSGEEAAKVEKFYGLFQTEDDDGRARFETLVEPTALASDDLVIMAGNVKRTLEARSREYTKLSEREFAMAQASRGSAQDVDLTLPDDETTLRKAHTDAVRKHSQLEAEQKAAKESREAAEQAQLNLKQVEEEYLGMSVEEAFDIVNARAAEVLSASDLVQELERQLAEARVKLTDRKSSLELANANLTSAELHEQTMAKLRETINAPSPLSPDPIALADAEDQVQTASAAIEQGAIVRRAKEQLEVADKHKKLGIEYEETSLQIREAARATDDILSAEVGKLNTPLRVTEGRLVLDTRRGVTYFSDLSLGERYALVIKQIAVPALGGDGGVLVLPQEAWEGLQPANKRLIDQVAKDNKVHILTAEAADGAEVTVEAYEPFSLLDDQ